MEKRHETDQEGRNKEKNHKMMVNSLTEITAHSYNLTVMVNSLTESTAHSYSCDATKPSDRNHSIHTVVMVYDKNQSTFIQLLW